MHIRNILCLVLILLFSSINLAQAQSEDSIFFARLEAEYNRFDSAYVRESVYLHLPKSLYNTGETIIYSVFVTDFSGKPINDNRNVYVELLNPEGKRIITKLHYLDDQAMAEGKMELGDSLTGGPYFIRAYTPYLQNLPTTYSFYAPVEIKSDKAHFYTPEFYQKLKKIRRKKNRVQLNYNVSGGFMLPDRQNQITFRITDGLGFPVKAHIKIKDKASKANYSISSDSAGIAVANIVPDEASEFRVRVKSDYRNLHKRLTIPIHKSVKIADYRIEKKMLKLQIQNPLPETNDTYARSFFLLGRLPGKTIFTKKIEIGNREAMNVSVPLPDACGTIDLILTDLGGKTVSVRKVYLPCKPGKIPLEYSFSDDSLRVQLGLSDGARFSVFVSSSEKSGSHTGENLIDYFLYRNRTSDILNPYVSSDVYRNMAENEPQALGFDFNIWQDSMPEFSAENAINITGKLMHSMLDLPVKNSKVEMFVLNKHYDRFETYTDENGRFKFENLRYPDTLKLRFESRNTRDKPAYIIEVNKRRIPEFTSFYDKDLKQLIKATRSGLSYYRIHRHFVHPKDSVADIPGKIHSTAGQILFFDEINIDGYSSTLKVIENYVIGIRSQSMSTLRGYNSFRGSSEPMYMIDGVPVDKMAVDNLPPQTVDRVEILKGGAQSAIYGLRGGNGVVAVYTKQGHTWQPGELFVNMTGYSPDSLDISNNEDEYFNDDFLYFRKTVGSDDKKFLFTVPLNRIKGDIFVDIQGFTSEGKPFVLQRKLVR